MQHFDTKTPPIFVVKDGKTFVRVTTGPITVDAPVGAYFIETIFARYVLPALRERSRNGEAPKDNPEREG